MSIRTGSGKRLSYTTQEWKLTECDDNKSGNEHGYVRQEKLGNMTISFPKEIIVMSADG